MTIIGKILKRPQIAALPLVLCGTAAAQSPLATFEAESGTLGADFAASVVSGATQISIATTAAAYNPGSAARVAGYSVTFPAAGAYQLHARVRVGPATYSDDSFFYGSGFGAKAPATDSNWVAVLSELLPGGFTAAGDVVTVGGGSAGAQVWKWVKFPTLFTVPAGALTQTFQIGGREDGLGIDKFVFAPSSLTLTVAELDSGMIAPPPDSVTFEGADGIAIHRFGVPDDGITADGANPASPLVWIDGKLVGSTLNGGLQGDGAVFRLATDGSGFETTNHLDTGSAAAHPQGGLLVSGSGFFGVSQTGGSSGTGTVFERKADGSVAIVRSFAALAQHTAINTGGACPSGALAASGSALYGTTPAGGANANGTLFSITTNGSGFAVLRDFTALDPRSGTNIDGAQPRGGVIVSAGKLYGAASSGGTGGTGCVFAMDVNGGNFTVLHHFAPLDPATGANPDGAIPTGGLVIAGGVIYGTTSAGGAGGKGSVFAVNTSGDGFTVLHAFSGADGASPAAGLTLSGNVLYGTTPAGGAGGTGTIFALDPTLPDFRVFHHFQALEPDGGNDFGACPVAPLLRAGNALFGTAFAGGPGGTGTVFRIPIPLTSQVSTLGNPNGTVSATFIGRGAPGSSYQIQAADSLASPWQDPITRTADASGFVIHPEPAANASSRFYRIREAP